MSAAAPGSGDLSPLAHRLAVLQGVRTVMALFVVAGSLVLPVGPDRGRTVAVTGVYLFASAAVELLRRRTTPASHAVLSAMLLADGAWIAYVLFHDGGPQGPLGFLVYFHVVAVTLLVSYRTGLKVAVWHALLTLVVAGDYDPALAFHAVALLLVAIVTAWSSALSERALRRGKAELAFLVALGDDLEQARTVDEVHLALLRHTTERLGFRRAAVASGAAAHDGIVGAVQTGSLVTMFEAFGPSRLGHRLGHPASRAPQLLADLDPSAWPVLDVVLPGATNVVLVPLVADGLAAAVLVAEWGGGRGVKVPAQTIAALGQSATHAALSLRNAALLAEVEHLATRDALTGLVNRRVFDEGLERAVHKAARTSTPLSLVVLDLDRFKLVNDSYGHQVGDDVLRAAGRALAAATRGEDLAARYGGEEFVVLLPDTDGETALAIAERLRAGIAAEVHGLAVTASAGVATLPADATTGTALVSAADRALYEAKRTGRDRAVRSGADTVVLDLSEERAAS